MTFHADYPEYESLAELAVSSELVVQVEFSGESRTVLIAPEAPEDPSDPRQNPTLGVDPAVLAGQPETPPIVTTVYEAKIANVIEGQARVGQLIEVQEMGGVHEGIAYVSDDDTEIDTGDDYLLFLSQGASGQPFQLLNPSQAAYPEKVDGIPQPLPANDIGVTTEDLIEYVD
ncbi:hypothetical protein [Actinotalea sp. C106]|uniref:hypothetical protein n=1 Tax=Actinotalea sp. C106 TaxID=2908644 RepID=UPI0020280C7C|nr:hypothetical protein [Actinotalea sp. C106]